MSNFDNILHDKSFSFSDTECVDVSLNPRSESQSMLVLHSGDGAEHAVLADNYVCGLKSYLAGSEISIIRTFTIAGTVSDKFLVCQIAGTETVAFSSIELIAGKVYSMQPDAEISGRKISPVNLARGTLIDTPHGLLPIEQLEDGDEVLTRDGGIQLIKDVALDRHCGLELVLNPKLRPVCIQAGALLGGLPGADLIVAQQHRLLLEDWRAAYFFGEEEILVPASSLLDQKNVTITCPETGIDYFQIELGQPELICANGLWSEASTFDQRQDEIQTSIDSVTNANSSNNFYIKKTDSYATRLPVLPHASAVSFSA